MNDVISTRLAPELRAQLQAEADERGLLLADVIRERVGAKPTQPGPGGEIVYAVPWRDGEELRASWDTWKGKPIACVRIWYEERTGQWRPGKRGINCSVERLTLVFDAISALMAEVEAE